MSTRSDSPGTTGRLISGSQRLSEKDLRVESLCEGPSLEPYLQERLRSGLLQVCEQHVQSRLRPARRDQILGRNNRCLPRLWPQAYASTNSESSPKMVKGGSSDDPSTPSVASDSSDGGSHASEKPHRQRRSHPSHVHCLPSARRTAS